jgi:ribonuclease-3
MTGVADRDSGAIAERLAIAERVTGHIFVDRDLLRRSLTHPSASEDRDPTAFYERLEFLGDAVVSLVVAEEIYRRFPSMTEGGMTRIRVSVVAGSVMATVADELGLGDALILGSSEMGTTGRGMQSALENTFEALTAALYLDAGLEVARDWVLRTLGPRIDPDTASTPENPKSILQEALQARGEVPAYRITGQQGPPHDRHFEAEVVLGDVVLGQGSGRTKKEAEASAASVAIERFGDDAGSAR